jgi:predicted aspartyl protease
VIAARIRPAAILAIAAALTAGAADIADATTYKDIAGEWCGEVTDYVFGPDSLIVKFHDARPANVFKITKYTYTNDGISIDWVNAAGQWTVTVFTEFSGSPTTMAQQQNGGKPRRPFHRCQTADVSPTSTLPSETGSSILVPLRKEGRGYLVPVLINNAVRLNFVIDSGADDVTIPADVVMTLLRTGTPTEADFIGNVTYRLADGSKVPSKTFRISSLTVGTKKIESVVGSVAPVEGALLLGQSFLGRFSSWSIDNAKQSLVLR